MAVRRERPDDQKTWTTLDAAGRTGDVPAFPLPDVSERELVLWNQLWTLPQSLEWERGRYALTVGNYVRAQVIAESRLAQPADRALVLRYETSLGLNTEGLARNRWKIEDMTVDPHRGTRTPAARSTKDRLRSIPGGAA